MKTRSAMTALAAGGPRARPRLAARVPRVRGFTLIEVLLATSLLAAGMGLAFLTLRNASVSTERAQEMASDNERLRAVQAFLRRQVTSALPLPLQHDPATGESTLFEARRDRIRFVASMPGYLSRGGPHLQTFELVRDAGGYRLEFQHQLLGADGPLDAEDEPLVLLTGIADGRFSTRTLAPDGGPADWQPGWEVPGQLPQLVRLQLELAGSRRHFPDLVMAPRLGVSYGPPAAALGGSRPGQDERVD